ncbi:choline kinase family protein [Labrenzia sp. PHM005]|uniref:choline kinase family protein n=1 Tax=Labrenzia sp. PHM005 TaxID=2590016 RepID=UPI00143CC833|nr:choline kinase family protein [Labrenzia sp. PHM005]
MPQSNPDIPASLPKSLQTAFQQCPELFAVMGLPVAADVMDGLSNHVLRVTAETGVFFLRLGKGGAKAPVDRYREAHNVRLAAEIGVGVAPIFIEPSTGTLVTRSVEGLVASGDDLPELLGKQLASLHTSGLQFEGDINPTHVFENLFSQVNGAWDALALELLDSDLRKQIGDLAALFETSGTETGIEPVPSHGDLSPGNCLFASGRVWLIDWEFSGMAARSWDLAYAIQEHGFDAVAESRFLQAYQRQGGLKVSNRDLQITKARCDSISAMWALLQISKGRDRKVFAPFAHDRFTRAFNSSLGFS